MSIIDCEFNLKQENGKLIMTIVGSEMAIVAMLCVAMDNNTAVNSIMEKVMPVYKIGNELQEILEGDKKDDDEASKQ
jgi:predicted transcriptional regulator YheO